MASVNKVILVGRLGRDPDEFATKDGGSVVSFSLATSRRHTNAAGVTDEATEWHEIVTFRQTAEFCKKYLRKGSLAYVEGRIQSRKYTGRDGAEKTRFSIIAEGVQNLTPRSEQPAADAPHSRAAQGEDIPF